MTIDHQSVGDARKSLGVLAQQAGVAHEVTILTIRGHAVAAIVHLGITPEQLDEVRTYAAGIIG